MARNITVDELWEYFSANRSALANEYQMIASDEENGVEIYLTEEKGFPYFSVEVAGEEVHTAETCSFLDAERTYDDLLTLYVYPEEDYETQENDDDDRVNEITGAVEDLLSVLLEADPYEAGLTPQEVDEIASVVEQYLFDECGFSVRHPTEVDGAVVQYPFGDPGEWEDGEEPES